MGWFNIGKIHIHWMIVLLWGINHPAIAEPQWREHVFESPQRPVQSPPRPTIVPQPTLTPQPTISQPSSYNEPTPRDLMLLGHELKTLVNRWQSSQLTEQALNGKFNLNKEIKDSSSTDSLAQELQRDLEQYNHFVEAKNFALARWQAETIYQRVGEDYLQNQPPAGAEIRAVWLDRGALVDARNEAGLAKWFDRFAKAGINVVFLETVNASYPIYPSRVAPEQNPRLVGWDPLASAVDLAHERQMELHAWTWIFAAANQKHNELMGQNPNYLGPVLTAHPEWAAGDRHGNLFHHASHKVFFDPAHPEVQAYLLNLLTEIATEYDVDGIQLDYIRYPFQEISRDEVYGFGSASRQLFAQQSGIDPVQLNIRDPRWYEWQKFRIDQVDEFVSTASQTLRQERPDIVLSAAVFAMPQARRLSRIQQNWEAWVQAGDIDLLVPMTYAEDTATLEQLTATVLNTFPQKSTLLLPGIQLLDLEGEVAIDQMQWLRQLPTSGYALFAASHLAPDFVQDIGDTKSILPLRDPLATIANRFETLEQEWAIALAERPWYTEAEKFRLSLERAQADPSSKNILLARTRWWALNAAIAPHLETYGQQHPYQMRVWKHRIAGIERLLDYGNRRFSLTH